MFCEGAMRRWHLLSRLQRPSVRRDSDRCFLVVEELEAREVLSPIILAPTFVPTLQTPEGVAYTFSGSSSFSVIDSPISASYQANLTATNGTITVTAIPTLTVTNNDTAAVTLVACSTRSTPSHPAYSSAHAVLQRRRGSGPDRDGSRQRRERNRHVDSR